MHDDTGAAQLRGAIAAAVDDIAEMLRERFVEHDGVRKRLRQWIADQGWRFFDGLPGESDAWSRLPPRDGEAGSPDGRPLPEGEE